jgi:hypothetical protein
MADHFWLGSLCLAASDVTATAARNAKAQLPSKVVGITDTITILEDMGNHIPDRSWMLYLLELFDSKKDLPAELNLICQFNNRDNFWAIFRGINRHKFTGVLPVVGHSYVRQIVMNKDNKSIEYSVTDKNTKQTEEFSFNVGKDDSALSYQVANHFTGLEWWNKSAGGNSPFPVRYKVEIANLMYGKSSADDSTKITYQPYNKLVPDNDHNAGIEYPISFGNLATDNGSIRYNVMAGKSNRGMQFHSPIIIGQRTETA